MQVLMPQQGHNEHPERKLGAVRHVPKHIPSSADEIEHLINSADSAFNYLAPSSDNNYLTSSEFYLAHRLRSCQSPQM